MSADDPFRRVEIQASGVELLRTFLRSNRPQDFDQVADNGGKIGIFSESYTDTTSPRYFVYA